MNDPRARDDPEAVRTTSRLLGEKAPHKFRAHEGKTRVRGSQDPKQSQVRLGTKRWRTTSRSMNDPRAADDPEAVADDLDSTKATHKARGRKAKTRVRGFQDPKQSQVRLWNQKMADDLEVMNDPEAADDPEAVAERPRGTRESTERVYRHSAKMQLRILLNLASPRWSMVYVIGMLVIEDWTWFSPGAAFESSQTPHSGNRQTKLEISDSVGRGNWHEFDLVLETLCFPNEMAIDLDVFLSARWNTCGFQAMAIADLLSQKDWQAGFGQG
nr:hypothetical protein Iba_chr14bCG3970 [Ipomoea batatas]